MLNCWALKQVTLYLSLLLFPLAVSCSYHTSAQSDQVGLAGTQQPHLLYMHGAYLYAHTNKYTHTLGGFGRPGEHLGQFWRAHKLLKRILPYFHTPYPFLRKQMRLQHSLIFLHLCTVAGWGLLLLSTHCQITSVPRVVAQKQKRITQEQVFPSDTMRTAIVKYCTKETTYSV